VAAVGIGTNALCGARMDPTKVLADGKDPGTQLFRIRAEGE
jgi:hypothetical protein